MQIPDKLDSTLTKKWEKSMSIIMPKIKGFKIMTPDMKTCISEHGPNELDHCRQLISELNDKKVLPGEDRKAGPVLHYIFEELEEDATVH
jgi:hypothetical protein